MNNMSKEDKKIVITGSMVAKFAGILAGISGIVHLAMHVFGVSNNEWSTVDWSVIFLCFGSCFMLFALTRKNHHSMDVTKLPY
jgi:hypothetical protein